MKAEELDTIFDAGEEDILRLASTSPRLCVPGTVPRG